MHRFARFCVILSALLLTTLFLSTASAQPADYEDQREHYKVDSMTTKLGRGVVNIFCGWLEIPNQVRISVKETDPVSGLVIGLFRGTAWTIARAGVGVFEVVTFPAPVPKEYKPVLKPAYIVKELWGQPAPIISDKNNNAWEGMENPGTPPYR